MAESKKHYGAIDGLRAFSAIGIVLISISFMIISGFSMCCGYYEKITQNKITVSEFYNKRYAKIWPFFALICILDIVASQSKTAIYEAFANLTLCFGLLPNPNICVIGVGWFLGVIFAFYLLFPFFAICFQIRGKHGFHLR